MSVQSYPTGLNKVQEIILLQSSYTMSIPSGTGTQTDTVTHNLNVVPFVDYMLSFDNGVTFVPHDRGFQGTDQNLHYLSVYSDRTKTYFKYASQSTPNNLTIIINYKIYVTEAA